MIGRRLGLGVGIVISLLLTCCGGDTEESPLPVGVSAAKGSSRLTIAGKAFYEDMPYTENGFIVLHVNTPIRHAIINLIAHDGIVLLSSSQTGEDGSFSFSNIDNSGRRGGVFLQIQAKNADDSASPAEVRSLQGALQGVSGPTLDDSSSDNFQSVEIISRAEDKGGAFNILDNFLKGGAFIQEPGFCPSSLNRECKAPFLTAFWEPGSGEGSLFDSGGPAIFISGGGGDKDADEYDDTVILHEYGHFIAGSFSHDNSPGGLHSLGDNTQDIRLSWSEGWATFFASAVLGSPLAVDTNAKGVFAFNIDDNTVTFIKDGFLTGGVLTSIFTTDEIANSSVLWDIMTATGFPSIWKSFTEIPLSDTATMESFSVLFMNQNPATKNSFQTILTGRRIELFPDAGESGESALIVNGSSQHHTLYTTNSSNPFGDEDIISFSATAGTPYTVKTLNLTNGADTFLTIDSGSGLTNDNADGSSYLLNCAPCPKNDQTTLSSSASFTPSTGGMLFVHVTRSPNAPL
ncbi:MAG: hypothetical protein HY037_03330, partial [Nitrospirae bacterium]|nr:hypothetical protein [Candidatus Troglogloeales bacterium]